MKVIHSSDWHIGHSLYGRKRYDESESFLTWMADLIEREKVDALLVAGDIFDTTTPSNRAQELYYNFLCRLAASPCRHVVITGGNHDSPSFLNAPRDILRFLNVYIVGSAMESPGDEVLVLADAQGEPELIVCAVPYLRDRDIRQAEAGESQADKEQKLLAGIRYHYQQVCNEAEQIRLNLNRPVPIVAMGHLFTTGGLTVNGDGVRALYLGSLVEVKEDIFPACIDYLALGHLHQSQTVGGSNTHRYCGSPLPMGFGEASQEKCVYQITFSTSAPQVEAVIVPRFQALEQLRGDGAMLAQSLSELKAINSSAWLEIIYEGDEIVADLRKSLDEAISGTSLEILAVKNNRVMARALSSLHSEETLDHLDVHQVFLRCLDAHEVPPSQHPALITAYDEVVVSLQEDDLRAE